MPRRRDSRSRTPPRSHRRSQDFSSGRASRHRSRTRSPQNQQGPSNQTPKTWKQTSHEWDSNRVYGLTLPKIVASNRLAREQGIAGMESMDVPLHKVISGEQQLGLAAGSTWSNCSVGKLSLETGSNFLWSADARASVRTSRTGRLGFCYCLECMSEEIPSRC